MCIGGRGILRILKENEGILRDFEERGWVKMESALWGNFYKNGSSSTEYSEFPKMGYFLRSFFKTGCNWEYLGKMRVLISD